MEVNLFFIISKHLLKKEMSMIRIILEYLIFSYKKILESIFTPIEKNFKLKFPNLKINFKCSYFNKLDNKKTKNLKRFSKDLFKIKFQKFFGFFIHLIPIQLNTESDLLTLFILPIIKTTFFFFRKTEFKASVVFLKILKGIKSYLDSKLKILHRLTLVYKKLLKKLLKKLWDHGTNDICFCIGIFERKKKTFFLKNLYENKLNILFKNMETKETILSIKKFTKKKNNLKFYHPFLYFLKMLKFGGFENRKLFFREIIFYKKSAFFTLLFLRNIWLIFKKKSNRLILDQISFCENLKIYKFIKKKGFHIFNKSIYSFLNVNFIEIKKKINCLCLKRELYENYINLIHIFGIFDVKKNSIKKIKNSYLNNKNFFKLKPKIFLRDCIRVFHNLIFCPFTYQTIFSEFRYIYFRANYIFYPTIFYFFLKAQKKNKKKKKFVKLEKENTIKLYRLKSDRCTRILLSIKSNQRKFFSKHFLLVLIVNLFKKSSKKSSMILFTFFNILNSFFKRVLGLKKKKFSLGNFSMRKFFRKSRFSLIFCLFLSNQITKTQKINVSLFILLNIIKTIHQTKNFFQLENHKNLFNLNLIYSTIKPFFLHYRTFVIKDLFGTKKRNFLYNEGFFLEIFLILNSFFFYGFKKLKISVQKILDLFNLYRKNNSLDAETIKPGEYVSNATQRKFVLLFLKNQINGDFSKNIKNEYYTYLY